jgi:hypothetical protein
VTTSTVTTQAELDAALADADVDTVIIDSPRGVWLKLRECGSATVEACGSATVEAYDSATVEACGSATVRAYDSATVEACGSATVRAYGSATVEACDSATVRAYDSATVRAGSHTAVHLHSGRASIRGGVLIDHTTLDLTDATTWGAYHGAEIHSGAMVLYKAVDADLRAGQSYVPTTYPIGEQVTATDWDPQSRCGNGLHFSVSPSRARSYYRGSGEPRYLEVAVPVDEIVTLDDKVKAKSCTVIREVDAFARPVETPAAVSE